MSAIFKTYLQALETALKAGNATEHTHRPALKSLLETFDETIVATNEPKRTACGAPDFIVAREGLTVGYLEAKDVGKSLDQIENSEQLGRYRRGLENLILTDYLDFRWYVDGELRQEARLARPQSTGKLKKEKSGLQDVEALLENFLAHQPEAVTTPKDLAQRMARLTHMIRDIIITAFEKKQESNLLQGWREAFAQVLIADLGLPERTADFADMVAQTLAYGLFSARVMDPTPKSFSRHEAQTLIPKSNPFLRRFFSKITSVELDDEPFVSFVDDLVNLLAHTDMDSVLADFGARTRQEDPVVHFYETFLAAYDPDLRESRGVYYTPEPVVSYIVRSVDHLLKTRFDVPQGLADKTKITIPNYDPSLKVKGKDDVRKTIESHKVLVLDPATGTGTFLYAVIDHIRQQFIADGNAGMWPGYVKNHLLPRLFGFELLMAPYAVAHFKLSLQLAGRDLPEHLAEKFSYHPDEGERLGIYLTDALEEAHEMTGLPLFTQWVADESRAANRVKRHLPVLVVMGNPPYSGHSENKGEWISDLLRGKLPDGGKTSNYYEVDGKPLGERNTKWLQDDYVKFIRFAQWRIEQSGSGIVAFISNNGYLDNPTFRGMRQSLMESFDEIYLLDLHGNAKKKDVAPDGSPDENVFDIQQGVSIGIFVKRPDKMSQGKVYHADLWGRREGKYKVLLEDDVETTKWEEINPQAEFYLLTPQTTNFLEEYKQGEKVTDIFPTNSVGIVTARDHFTIHRTKKEIWQTVQDFLQLPIEEARNKYKLRADSQSWEVHLAQKDIKNSGLSQEKISPILYRPFDKQFTYFTGNSNGFICRPRFNVMQHFQELDNKGLHLCRQIVSDSWQHILATNQITDDCYVSTKTKERGYTFPLYLYPTEDNRKQKTLFEAAWEPDEAHGGRVPNLNPTFVAEMEEKLGLEFHPNLTGLSPSTADGVLRKDLSGFITPEDIFHYIYAVFHSPTYRERYAEFLKIDFPRVPITSDEGLFRALCALGQELVSLHLLESADVNQPITSYPIPGDNDVISAHPKYTPPTNEHGGRVHINKKQYFEGVPPEVWEFQVGGYQVLHKWLKDRKFRTLSYDELTHYQKIVVTLQKTMALMEKIDETIPEFPIV